MTHLVFVVCFTFSSPLEPLLSFTICRFWVYNRPSKKCFSSPPALFWGGLPPFSIICYWKSWTEQKSLLSALTVTLKSISWRRQTPSYPWERVKICKERIPRISNNKVKKCPLLSLLKKSADKKHFFFCLAFINNLIISLPNGPRIKQTVKHATQTQGERAAVYKLKYMYEITCHVWHHNASNSLVGLPVYKLSSLSLLRLHLLTYKKNKT